MKQNTTLSNSEFCKMLANIFPALDRYATNIAVYDGQGNYAIYAKETAKGYSSAVIFGKPYSKMSAAEKKEAVEAVINHPVEVVVEKSRFGGEYKSYWTAGGWNERLERDRNQHWYESRKASLIRIENFRNC